MVFPASENNAPDACLDPTFHEGLAALEVRPSETFGIRIEPCRPWAVLKR